MILLKTTKSVVVCKHHIYLTFDASRMVYYLVHTDIFALADDEADCQQSDVIINWYPILKTFISKLSLSKDYTRMKKASFEITIKEKSRRLTFQLRLTHHLVTQNNLIKTDFQQRNFPSLQTLKNYLLQQNRRNRAAFLQVSVLKFIIFFSTQITLITIEDVRQRLSNTILDVLLPRCRFLTSLQLSFKGIYHFEEKVNQQIVNHCENKITLFGNKNNGLCKFIKSLTFSNETISSQQIANLTLKPFTFLSNLSIINHNINNRVLQSFSKADWPNLSTLVLLVTDNTADGLKILRKHSFFKLSKLMFKLELGQEASRKITKVHVLKQIQIVPENFYLQSLFQGSQMLLNMKCNLFLKDLMKSHLLSSEKYMNCEDLQAVKDKLSDGILLRF